MGVPVVRDPCSEWLERGVAAVGGGHQTRFMQRVYTVFATLLLGAMTSLGCGTSGTPASVAQAFYEEMATGDIEAAKRLSTPETAELLDVLAATHCTEMFESIAAGGTSDVRIEESTAWVSFVEGHGFATVPLVELDGAWKVDFATMMAAHAHSEPVGMTL